MNHAENDPRGVTGEHQASDIFERLGLGIVFQPLLADERLRACSKVRPFPWAEEKLCQQRPAMGLFEAAALD